MERWKRAVVTGFGLYETLRLVIPGSIAVAVLTITMRLATGEGALLTGGPFEAVIDALQGATFLFAALAVGFLLYLIDLPTRARLSQGDPENGVILPTSELRKMLEGTKQQSKAFSLYFILSDGRLPPELHRRVYFFGGMYRIYFDARVLAAAGVALGGPFALAVQGGGISDWIKPSYLLMVVAILGFITITALIGESKHAIESMRKQARSDGLDFPSATLRSEYLQRARRGALAMWGPVLALLILGSVGGFLTDAAALWMRLLGMATVVVAVVLWAMVELGPPEEVGKPPETRPHGPIRGRLLTWLGLKPSTRVQYTQLQRGLMDLALFVPPLVAGAAAAQNQGRPAMMVLAWAILAAPAALIMGVRKHEQRLLASYNDQVNWLRINEQNIKRLAEDGPGEQWF